MQTRKNHCKSLVCVVKHIECYQRLCKDIISFGTEHVKVLYAICHTVAVTKEKILHVKDMT